MIRKELKMYNVLSRIGILLILAISVASCGNNGSDAGEGLLTEAENAITSGDFLQAYCLIDSINVVSKDNIELRKRALHLRTIADEKAGIADSIVNDSVLRAETARVEALRNSFKFIKTKDMVEGYTVHKKAAPLVQRTGIDVRINEQNELYIVSLLRGVNIKHTQISATVNGTTATSSNVPYNGSTNYRFKDEGVENEMVTFRGAKADSLCMLIRENPGAKVVLTFIGSSRHKVNLSAAEAKIIADTYNYSQALQRKKKSEGLALYYANKISIARKQQAATQPTNKE